MKVRSASLATLSQKSVRVRHRENRENDPKKSLSGKTQGIWKFCPTTGKTQGILFAQVVNSLILMGKDIAILPRKFPFFPQKLDESAESVLCM